MENQTIVKQKLDLCWNHPLIFSRTELKTIMEVNGLKLIKDPTNEYVMDDQFVYYKRCPFIDAQLKCRINAQKPLICRTFPYALFQNGDPKRYIIGISKYVENKDHYSQFDVIKKVLSWLELLFNRNSIIVFNEQKRGFKPNSKDFDFVHTHYIQRIGNRFILERKIT